MGCGGALATWSTLLGTSCLPVLPGFLKEMRILCEIRGFVLILLFVLFFSGHCYEFSFLKQSKCV